MPMTHPDPVARAYLIVSPGRNEAQYMRRTLDSLDSNIKCNG